MKVRGKIVKVERSWGWNHRKQKECWNYEFYYENDSGYFYDEESNESLFQKYQIEHSRELIKEINQQRGY